MALLGPRTTLSQFHQFFLYAQLFLTHIQKLQKDTVDLTVFFAVLGCSLVKATRKYVDEIDPLNLTLMEERIFYG